MSFLRTVYALWLRQIKRSIRAPARLIGGLGMPVLFLVALGFGLGGVFAKAGNGNYISFLAPGVVTMAVLFTSMFSGIEVIWDRQFGFLKETLVAPTSRFAIMLGRTLGGATVALAQGIIVFVIAFLIGYRPVSFAGIFPALGFLLLIAILFTALGTAIGSLLEDMQAFPLIMNFLMMPLFFLSGAIFPLDSAPQIMQTVISFNLLSYGVDAVRGSLSGVAHFPIALSFAVLLGCCVVALAFGAYCFSKIQL